MKKILGISAFYHDAAAALLIDGEIIAAAQEERFTRVKHTAEFPTQAIRYCLEEGGLTLDELDAVVFYEKPFLKFERLLETYYAFAPRGLVSFLKAMPVWLHDKLFLKKRIREGLAEIESYQGAELKLLFSEHHLSHAASAFFASPFAEAAILTIDGAGEWATATMGTGQGRQIQFHKELRFPHSVGLLYSAFTYYLGFTVNAGEYKLMGLAPYGDPEAAQTQAFLETIKTHLADIKEDGSVWLDQRYFHYATGLKMVRADRWEKLLGIPPRLPEATLTQSHANLALAIQTLTEEIVLKMAREAKRLTGLDRLCLAGGVALNCVANGKLLREGIFEEIYIQPAAGDAGGALGAALAVHHLYFEAERHIEAGKDLMQGTYLGPSFSDKEISSMNRRNKAESQYLADFEHLTEQVASYLAEGKVVGWFQGRMEFGPRALGNRSILGDARNPRMQQSLNLKIKYRESFRPFAPSVLEEVQAAYFDLSVASPYMLLVAPVKASRRVPLPPDYAQRELAHKLKVSRSDIPAVTHLDYSARVQTVSQDSNPSYWKLLQSFRELSGTGLLVNTSFNVRGEPIVCTPNDAYRCFMSTEMDYLVIGNFLYCKTDQPDWENQARWSRPFSQD